MKVKILFLCDEKKGEEIFENIETVTTEFVGGKRRITLINKTGEHNMLPVDTVLIRIDSRD